MRTASIDRKTNETDIKLKLNIDGKGDSNINTGCGFLDHMLTLLARHARFDLEVTCKGDTKIVGIGVEWCTHVEDFPNGILSCGIEQVQSTISRMTFG